MDPTLPPLIQALLEPQRYAGEVQRVELIQTHISWVLLAGDFAYKIKKPLKLSFLDFSTLAQRQASCNDELRLNRRFAPDIYLSVVGIFNTPQDPQWQGQAAPIEYAVKMRRFDDAGRLDRVCARGELTSSHLSDLAGTLVAFHSVAAIAPLTSRFGSASQVMVPIMANIQDLMALWADEEGRLRLDALRVWTEARFHQLSPLMEARKQAGRVRECHGDLHLANLVLIDQRVRMFDCIEFSEDLRWIDVASEIAFTFSDLLVQGQPGLADWLVNEVLSRSGDYEAALLLRFYAVYLALVRAKVAAIRVTQTGQDDGAVMAYVALAERLVKPPPVRLVITHGLSGCGKTVASSQLLQSDSYASTLRLRSDVERKRLANLASTACSNSALHGGLYGPDAHHRTYAHLRALADMLLRAGWSVIVDAAFLKHADRESFRILARDAGAAFGILAPKATFAQLRLRIQRRSALGNDASEATLDVLEHQIQTMEPLLADELKQVQVLGSRHPVTA